MTSALDEGVVVGHGALSAPAVIRRDVGTDLDLFIAKLRRARVRLVELSAMLEDEGDNRDLVLGVERAAIRVRDGVLAEARSAAEGLIDEAVAGTTWPISVRTPDVEVALVPDDPTVGRHHTVVQLQRGVEELSSALVPLVDRRREEAQRGHEVRTPPDNWTIAHTFADLYR